MNCIRCRSRKANVPEPCCSAPDCDTTVFLICAECDDEWWYQLATEAEEKRLEIELREAAD